MKHEDRELLSHGVIGGIVVVILTTFHQLTERWINHQMSIWTWIIFVVGGFILGFLGTAFLDKFLRKQLWKAPMLLKDLTAEEGGDIRGLWIDAIFVDSKITMGSIIRIESSWGEGFSVSGKTYNFENGNLNTKVPPNTFEGRGGSLFGQNGICYGYQGEVVARNGQPGKKHFGIVYYQFFRRDQENYLVGAFLAREEHLVHHVFGKKLTDVKDSQAKASLEKWVEKEVSDSSLREHLREMFPDSGATSTHSVNQ